MPPKLKQKVKTYDARNKAGLFAKTCTSVGDLWLWAVFPTNRQCPFLVWGGRRWQWWQVWRRRFLQHQGLIYGFSAEVWSRLSCYRFVPFPRPCVGTSTKVVPALLVPFFKEDDALERPVEVRPPVPFATRRWRFLAPPVLAIGSEAPTERESASEVVMIVLSESAPPRLSATLCFHASFERWNKHSAAWRSSAVRYRKSNWVGCSEEGGAKEESMAAIVFWESCKTFDQARKNQVNLLKQRSIRHQQRSSLNKC